MSGRLASSEGGGGDKDWIPGQARNDVGLGSGVGLWAIQPDWIPGQARNDVGLGSGGGFWAIQPDWIPGQARNDV